MQCTAIILVVYQTVSRAKSVNWHKIEAANGLDMPLLLYSCTIEEQFFFCSLTRQEVFLVCDLFEKKAISILAGNLNSGRSYLITAVPLH